MGLSDGPDVTSLTLDDGGDGGPFAGTPAPSPVRVAQAPTGTMTDAEPRLDDFYRMAQRDRTERDALDWFYSQTGGPPQPQAAQPAAPAPTQQPTQGPIASVPQDARSFAAGEQAWGQRFESMWSFIQNALEARQRSMAESGQVDRDAALVQWLADHARRNVGDSQRRQQEASQIAAGLRAGPRSSYARNLVNSAGRGLVDNVVAGMLKGMGYTAQLAQGPLTEVEENGIYQMGAAVSDWAKRVFPNDPARQHEFSGVLAEGVGSMVGFFGPGMAAQILTRGGPAATAWIYGASSLGTGALSQMGQMTDEARSAAERGVTFADGRPVTEADVRRTLGLAMPIGATEAVPIARMFNRTGGTAALRIVMQMIEEGGQEFGQQILSNIVARSNFDEARRIDEGAWQGLAVGGLLGAGMGGGVEVSRRRDNLIQEARLNTGRTRTDVSGVPQEGTAPPLAGAEILPPAIPGQDITTGDITREMAQPSALQRMLDSSDPLVSRIERQLPPQADFGVPDHTLARWMFQNLERGEWQPSETATPARPRQPDQGPPANLDMVRLTDDEQTLVMQALLTRTRYFNMLADEIGRTGRATTSAGVLDLMSAESAYKEATAAEQELRRRLGSKPVNALLDDVMNQVRGGDPQARVSYDDILSYVQGRYGMGGGGKVDAAIGRPAHRFTPGGPEEKFILSNYGRMNIRELADGLGYAEKVVARELRPILARAGVEPRSQHGRGHFLSDKVADVEARNDDIEALYREGKTLAQIARATQATHGTVAHALRRMRAEGRDIPKRPQGHRNDDALVEDILDRIDQGHSFGDIAKELGVTRNKVAGIVHRARKIDQEIREAASGPPALPQPVARAIGADEGLSKRWLELTEEQRKFIQRHAEALPHLASLNHISHLTMMTALRDRGPVTLEPHIVKAVLDEVSSGAVMARGYRIGALQRVEPRARGYVDATFQTADGGTYKVSMTRAQFGSLRAFHIGADPGGNLPGQVIGFIRPFAPGAALGGDLAGQFSKSLWGELSHELIHVNFGELRVREPALVARVLGHAEHPLVRVMDTAAEAYLTAIKREDTVGNFVGSGVTIRDVYDELYRDRSNKEQLMEEEAVAHLVEMNHHGALSLLPPELRTAIEADIQALYGAMVSGRAPVKPNQDGIDPAIRAFHGSPHDFDRFDSTRIGTGEGAQAFGHGLYFAEKEGTAKYYGQTLAGRATTVSRWPKALWKKYNDDMARLHAALKTAYDQVVADGERSGVSDSNKWDWSRYLQAKAAVDEAAANPARLLTDAERLSLPQPRLYEVSLDVEPEQLLDWDKPLKDQPPKVREAIYGLLDNARDQADNIDDMSENAREAWGGGADPKALRDFVNVPDDAPGSRWHDALRRAYAHWQEDAASRLQEAGIPGIRYLDQGSRSKGEGTYNYVIFDDSLIKIVAKDGKPVSQEERADVIAQTQESKPSGDIQAAAGGSLPEQLSRIPTFEEAIERVPDLESRLQSLGKSSWGELTAEEKLEIVKPETTGTATDQGTVHSDGQSGVSPVTDDGPEKSGLDMSLSARKARAEAMGFDTSTVYYKGYYPYSSGGPVTNVRGEVVRDDGPYILKDQLSGFFSANPEVANRFSGLGWFDHNAVAPVYLKYSNPLEIDAKGKHAASVQFESIAKRDGTMDELKQFQTAFDNGYDAVIIRNTVDEGDIIRILSPQQVRSVNAAFDPREDGSSQLMAAAGGDMPPLPPGGTPPAPPASGQPPGRGNISREFQFNWGAIESQDQVKAMAGQMMDTFRDELVARGVSGGGRGHVQSWKQTADKAGMLNAVEMLFEQGKSKGMTYDASGMEAMGNLYVSSMENLKALVAKAAGPDATPEDMVAMRHQITVHRMVQAEFWGGVSEAGRTLNILKKVKGASQEYERGLNEIIQGTGGLETNRALAEAIADYIGRGDYAGADRMIEKSKTAKTLDAITEIWKGGLLRGPFTHVVNFLGNSSVIPYSIVERAVAGMIGNVISPVDGVKIGEAAAMATGIRMAMREAVAAFAESFRTGQQVFGQGQTEQQMFAPRTSAEGLGINVPSTMTARGQTGDLARFGALLEGQTYAEMVRRPETALGLGLDLISTYVTAGFRALGAADSFFKVLNNGAELMAQAVRQANQELLRGEIAEDAFRARVGELYENPTEAMRMAAKDFAEYNTFTNEPGPITQKLEKLREWDHPVAKFAGHVILPFVRTPGNLMNFSFAERTPLALATRQFWREIDAGGDRANMALAKMGLGTIILMVALDLAIDGHITGTGPQDPRQRELWLRNGWRPMSVRIPRGTKPDGTPEYVFVPLQRLDPIASIPLLGAELAEVFAASPNRPPHEFNDTFFTGAFVISELAMNKPTMQGFSNIMKAITQRERFAESWGRRTAASFVPADLAYVTNRMDPTMRQTWDIVSALKARTPGLSQTLPPSLDFWGRERTRVSGLGDAFDAVSPIFARTNQDSQPIDRELGRLGFYPTHPRSLPVLRSDAAQRALDGIPQRRGRNQRGIEGLIAAQPEDPVRGESNMVPTKGLPLVQNQIITLTANTPASKLIRDNEERLVAAGRTSAITRLSAYGNKTLREVLNDLVENNTAYRNARDDQRRETIQDILRDFRTAASAQVVAEFPELRQRRDAMRGRHDVVPAVPF